MTTRLTRTNLAASFRRSPERIDSEAGLAALLARYAAERFPEFDACRFRIHIETPDGPEPMIGRSIAIRRYGADGSAPSVDDVRLRRLVARWLDRRHPLWLDAAFEIDIDRQGYSHERIEFRPTPTMESIAEPHVVFA